MSAYRPSLVLAAAVVLLAACQSAPPQPSSPPCSVCGYAGPGVPPGIALPPGLRSPFKPGDSAAVSKAVELRVSPSPSADVVEKLPPGTVVKLKSRVLNSISAWWLVDYQLNSGWIQEGELPAPR